MSNRDDNNVTVNIEIGSAIIEEELSKKLEQDQNVIINEKKQIRNRFIIQLISTTGIIAFCTYSIVSEGKLPDKNSIVYSLLAGVIGVYLPQPKIFDS